MEVSTDYFIGVIECNRILFDKSSKDFKNAVKKNEAWKRIAHVTNMNVDEAKKRYTSLRQKYCREKQKDELNRRFKRSGGVPWIYSERMRFLDDFIKPRTTFSNDTNFEDVRDINNDDGFEMALNDPNDNDLPPEDASEEAANSNREFAVQSDMQTISYHPKDVQRNISFQLIDYPEAATTFFSEYTGELTEFSPPLEPFNQSEEACGSINSLEVPSHPKPVSEIGNQSVEHDGSIHTMDSLSQREPLPEGVNQSTEPNVISSASRTQSQQEPLPRSDPRKRKATTEHHQAKIGSTAAQEPRNSIVQPSIQSSTATAARQVPRNTFTQPSNQPTRPALASTAISSSAKDKTMENIRYKMDSCLTAIATKVAEKPQRSPHSPFLAYLGTKLPNVPKERIADLEKDILNLVDSFSQ